MGFGGLYISVSGINANKKALDTVSHNIANVNNPNYVRQSAIHSERSSTRDETGFPRGTGVNTQNIRQIRDEFLDIKLRREMATFGYHSTKSEILNQVETIFNEISSSGLQNVMDEFWDGWAELYKEPDSLTIRGIVHENAVAFTTTVNHISTQLRDLQFELNKEMLNKANEVNTLLAKMAEFNSHIKRIEGYGPHVSANDFRDERNAVLDRLAELIPITHYENQYGEEVVSLFGKDLVSSGGFSPVDIELNSKGHGEIYWSDTGGSIDLKGLGELGGYIDARDSVVVEYQERLNILVERLGEAINEIHMSGKDLHGGDGLPFFVGLDSQDPAAAIRVNPSLGSFERIAVSESGAIGDGEKAKEILDLRERPLFSAYGDHDDTPIMSIDRFYRELVMSIGLERQQSRTMVENQQTLIDQIRNRRQEISSVSLDEEMADMLKYQHSYIANSRVINAIDEMIDLVVNRMGIAGR
ncbi:MAG: flagellar hook-associated protein FlgK [Tissierellia bacterium]|nr:flagellar hook-associated protein FlgK [Tissierellia bacterium]